MELTAENVKAKLAPLKQFAPFWTPVFYERVDSTNDIALSRLYEKSWLQLQLEGNVIIADEQVKGKGRLDRTWYTPPGTALIVSVIFPVRERNHLPRVTMLGAVAIAQIIENIEAADVGIKWPNDVQV